ncbi:MULTISPECIES: ATP-dependent 6-phosphofructokinase [Mesonia]|uniref:ATP-dependent 6-phosphofructokinase 1 n=1 Tax=Mesonia oceanica TaxID=2687242 RepID=A0AC61Y4H4_9FLAO|nr:MULTISPECIES: ATP-dependent 6-phosphofructokinase [Mesonia]MAS70306.1 6-phosphofructokinase [Zunongwangia sp.]MBJ98735.1 6-phosphofructokinase [Flavobacteriaceae bacterium]MAN29498.1 6-phosphofructokinase [Mesonia sp.]MAQ41634.1 6-phosphofructokinase [Mesonia sp.]VVU99380.1 ATP-dependent 6-phosphofructokinase 1 [Mesonia oceanica]|tara:strand:- start:187 stop:1158 length:972 start_codon:yes stop_codon:yes gene_type:complete
MNQSIKHIGVFTSGGDSPGMNAVLYAIAKAAEANGIKATGIRKGYEGLIDGDFMSLETHQLQKLVHKGGTILKTARSKRFMELKGRKKALQTLQINNIDALIAIGGDGTFKGLLAFSEIYDIPFIGIPGTIDNDISGTDYTLGFDSAVNTAIENIDKIRDTAESHNRVFIVEVMGRDSGYIALHSGLTVGADAILIPESGKDIIDLLNKVKDYDSEDAFLVVVSEGDEIGAELVASKIKEINHNVDLRITKLGHVQRGGNPSALDRMLGIRLGVAAIDALLQGKNNVMVGILNNELYLTPFEEVVKQHQVNDELQKLLELFGK